jgi:carnosine N-methyltransferase
MDSIVQVSRTLLNISSQYAKIAHFNTTHLRRQSFYALPRAHLDLLAAPPFSYLDTLIAVDDGIDKNADLARAILQSGLRVLGISEANIEWKGKATSNDLEKARSTLRQFYRDWSSEGSAERETVYGIVIKALQKERMARNRARMRVLVPGAGLGRLVFDLCRAGFDTEGNEISYHQLLASSYILNICPQAKMHTLFPWIHSFSNHRNRSNHLRSVLVPDILPASELATVKEKGEMSMSGSDFLCLYGNEEQKHSFDAVATVFFLDTAPNVIRYIETIRNCLKPGGLLLNTGPLLWHFENNAPGTHGHEEEKSREKDLQGESDTPNLRCPAKITNPGIAEPGSFELTDDEVIALVEEMGFRIETRLSNVQAPYIQDPESMLQNTYQASHWVARKL